MSYKVIAYYNDSKIHETSIKISNVDDPIVHYFGDDYAGEIVINVDSEETVSLLATPEDGYEFSHWVYRYGSTESQQYESTDHPFVYDGSNGDLYIRAVGQIARTRAKIQVTPYPTSIEVKLINLSADYQETIRTVNWYSIPSGKSWNKRADASRDLANGITESQPYLYQGLTSNTWYDIKCTITNIQGSSDITLGPIRVKTSNDSSDSDKPIISSFSAKIIDKENYIIECSWKIDNLNGNIDLLYIKDVEHDSTVYRCLENTPDQATVQIQLSSDLLAVYNQIPQIYLVFYHYTGEISTKNNPITLDFRYGVKPSIKSFKLKISDEDPYKVDCSYSFSYIGDIISVYVEDENGNEFESFRLAASFDEEKSFSETISWTVDKQTTTCTARLRLEQYDYVVTSNYITLDFTEEPEEPQDKPACTLNCTFADKAYSYDNGRVTGIIKNYPHITAANFKQFRADIDMVRVKAGLFTYNAHPTVNTGTPMSADIWTHIIDAIYDISANYSKPSDRISRQEITEEFIDKIESDLQAMCEDLW